MSEPVVEAPVVAPVVTDTTAPAATDDTLASHEEAFGPNAGPDDDEGEGETEGTQAQEPRRRGSRSKSKQAAAVINRLTRERGDLERRVAAMEAERAKSTPVEARPSVPHVPPVPASEFNEPEPTYEEFLDKPGDPWVNWQRALAAYDRRKERAEEQGQQAKTQHQRQVEDTQRYYRQVEATHKQRLIEAATANPEHLKALQSVKVAPPPLLDWAIMLDEESAGVALFLATHPDVLDEFVLYTEAKPVTEQTVAITRRLLRQRMSAASSGSVAPSKALPPAPTPPNPLRTGSITLPDGPPGDDSSLAAHEKHYGRKHR